MHRLYLTLRKIRRLCRNACHGSHFAHFLHNTCYIRRNIVTHNIIDILGNEFAKSHRRQEWVLWNMHKIDHVYRKITFFSMFSEADEGSDCITSPQTKTRPVECYEVCFLFIQCSLLHLIFGLYTVHCTLCNMMGNFYLNAHDGE